MYFKKKNIIAYYQKYFPKFPFCQMLIDYFNKCPPKNLEVILT